MDKINLQLNSKKKVDDPMAFSILDKKMKKLTRKFQQVS
jgi:hypothetical protein